ncbi:MAG TPA: AlpA family transcriptional regulator [Paraburkholderia sp.]|uniref:AlpA family transcriptional regulator n=1 Tax=Paraburkholderia sp. TaxID=1926495 RepID=UPI002ED17388
MNQPIRMLRLPAVIQKTGLSRSQIYRLVEMGSFPGQVHLGERTAAWIEAEIEQWLTERINRTRAAGVEGKASGT